MMMKTKRARWRWTSDCTLGGALLVAGCGGLPAGDGADNGTNNDNSEPSAVALPITAATPPAEFASSRPVVITWLDDPGSGTIAKTDFIRVQVRNTRNRTLSVALTLRAAGLDSRKVSRSLTTLSLTANQTKVYNLAIGSIPVQSVGSITELQIQGAGTDNGQSFRALATKPLFADFNTTFTTATFRTQKGAASRTQGIVPASLSLSALNLTLDTPRGRVRNSSGTMVDVTTLTRNQVLATEMLDGIDGWNKRLAIGSQIPLPPPASTIPQVAIHVCAVWPAEYDDATGLIGDDFLNTPGLSNYADRYGDATVLDTADNVIWNGSLGSDGCTPTLFLKEGNYSLLQYPLVRRLYDDNQTPTEFRVFMAQPGMTFEDVQIYLTRFHATPSTGPTVNLTVANSIQDHVTNVMAALGQVLVTPDIYFRGKELRQIGTESKFVGQHDIFVNTGCGGLGSCAPESNVWLGPNNDGVPAAWQRGVMLHELGHAQMYSGLFGGFNGTDFNDLPSEQVGIPPLCRCDHVSASNAVHCLQSLEPGGAAISEGYGHYFASKILNNQSQANCSFPYYKEVLLTAGQLPVYPPVSVSCRTPVKWMANHCLDATRHDSGIEYDWMQFLWNLDTTGANLTNRGILESILTACGGDSCTVVGGTTQKPMNYNLFYEGVDSYYGFNSQEMVHLRTTSDATGVNW
jgi:hypothetical protein